MQNISVNEYPSQYPQSMQKSANNMSQLLIEGNKGNVKQIRELLKNINVWRGHSPDAPITQWMGLSTTDLDGTSSMQPATHAVHLTTEETTKDKFIINVVVKKCAILVDYTFQRQNGMCSVQIIQANAQQTFPLNSK